MKEHTALQSRNQNQRDFHRMEINAPAIVIYVHNDEMVREQAICNDLSATGVSVHMGRPLQSGDDIELVIKGKDVPALDIKAKVLRCSEADNGGYLLGCAITSMR